MTAPCCRGAYIEKVRARESLPDFLSLAPNLKEFDLSIAFMLLIIYIIRFLKLLGSEMKKGGTSLGRESNKLIPPVHEVDMAYITGHVGVTLNTKTNNANEFS